MMRFPLNTLLDEQACYDFLLQVLHPGGLACPLGHLLPPQQAPHDRHRAPILDYRCRRCGAVFNLFTHTLFSKTRYRCSTIVLLLRGIAWAGKWPIEALMTVRQPANAGRGGRGRGAA